MLVFNKLIKLDIEFLIAKFVDFGIQIKFFNSLTYFMIFDKYIKFILDFVLGDEIVTQILDYLEYEFS